MQNGSNLASKAILEMILETSNSVVDLLALVSDSPEKESIRQRCKKVQDLSSAILNELNKPV